MPGGRAQNEGPDAVRALSHGEVFSIREHVEEILPPPPTLEAHVHVSSSDGLWIRVREPLLLRVEPENRIGPRGFPASVLLASRASKKHVTYLAEFDNPQPGVDV
ncbi:MAG: hypothetical protein WEA10_04890 [Actinomycetota bacterium]